MTGAGDEGSRLSGLIPNQLEIDTHGADWNLAV
jgi:hypothetical protein